MQRLEEALRQPFELVGAYRQPITLPGQSVERRFEVRERTRAVGNVLSIIRHERFVQTIDVGRRALASIRRQRIFDHPPRSSADQRPGGFEGNDRQSLLREGVVERIDEVGGGIDQRAVEIEDDGEHALA